MHLADWPALGSWPADDELASAMDLVRAVCSTALGLRKARQLRVRLPLARLTVAHPDALSLAPYAELIRDEVNVKDVALSADPASLGTFELAVNPRVLGPQDRRQGAGGHQGGQGGELVASRRIDHSPLGSSLQAGEYELRLVAADPDSTSALPGSAGLVALDTAVTPELAAEGTARDVVRLVQQARRDAGLAVSDRIRLTVGADGRGGGRRPRARGVPGRRDARGRRGGGAPGCRRCTDPGRRRRRLRAGHGHACGDLRFPVCRILSGGGLAHRYWRVPSKIQAPPLRCALV